MTQGNTSNWQGQFDNNFFLNTNLFQEFYFDIKIFESPIDEIIAKSIHFDNFLIWELHSQSRNDSLNNFYLQTN